MRRLWRLRNAMARLFHLINRVGRELVDLGGFVEDGVGAAIVKLAEKHLSISRDLLRCPRAS
jgi:hypothetical protein